MGSDLGLWHQSSSQAAWHNNDVKVAIMSISEGVEANNDPITVTFDPERTSFITQTHSGSCLQTPCDQGAQVNHQKALKPNGVELRPFLFSCSKGQR